MRVVGRKVPVVNNPEADSRVEGNPVADNLGVDSLLGHRSTPGARLWRGDIGRAEEAHRNTTCLH